MSWESAAAAIEAGFDLSLPIKAVVHLLTRIHGIVLRTVGFGCILVVEALWERLGIGTTFRDICKAENLKVPYERALLAMTANRLCEPESKLGVWDRWLSKVYLPSCEGLKLEHMYEAMDLFYDYSRKHRSIIMRPL